MLRSWCSEVLTAKQWKNIAQTVITYCKRDVSPYVSRGCSTEAPTDSVLSSIKQISDRIPLSEKELRHVCNKLLRSGLCSSARSELKPQNTNCVTHNLFKLTRNEGLKEVNQDFDAVGAFGGWQPHCSCRRLESERPSVAIPATLHPLRFVEVEDFLFRLDHFTVVITCGNEFLDSSGSRFCDRVESHTIAFEFLRHSSRAKPETSRSDEL